LLRRYPLTPWGVFSDSPLTKPPGKLPFARSMLIVTQ
jgi:hypothetical protein